METAAVDTFKINWPWVLTFVVGPGAALLLAYMYFTDPLRTIPGPFLAKFTGAWVLLLDLSGKRSTTVHELHKKHGPVVRVGPKQLCFASPEALKEIYGANSKYPKAPIYDTLGFKSTFTTRNRDEYRQMKKRITPSFSPAAVADLEPCVHDQIEKLVKCFDKRVDQPLDVLPWFRMLALGVVGEGFASDSFGGLENEKSPELLNHIDEVFPSLWVWWMFPTTSKILNQLPLKPVRNFLHAAEKFKKYCTTVYDKYMASYDPMERHDLIARMVSERKLLSEKNQDIPRHVTDTGIIEELTNLVFAGTDTTSNTLTYLFWELSNHPEWQLKMRDELNDTLGGQRTFGYDSVSELPVLDAVVQEILRLRPAAPSGLQRLTPEFGAVIDGIAVPGQVTVSCQALTAQREPTIFPEPDRFNPQRWLDAKAAGTVDLMREQLTVFGKGTRACLGRRLATMELKCTTAVMARRYNFEIGSPTTDDDMEMMDFSVLIPKGQRCILKLARV